MGKWIYVLPLNIEELKFKFKLGEYTFSFTFGFPP